MRPGNLFSLDVGPDYAGRRWEADCQTLRRGGATIRANAAGTSTATSP